MTKDSLIKLVKYQTDVKLKLQSVTLPAKHANRPDSYKQFLERELKKVTTKIDTAQLTEVKK